MDEFEQLEKTCTNELNEQQRRQNASPGRGVQNRTNNAAQKRKKKLFDDSESEEQAPEEEDDGGLYQSNKGRDPARSPKSPHRSPTSTNQGRSNLVNKMFYKDQKMQPNGSKKQLQQNAHQEGEARKQELAASEQVNEQMQELLNKKQEELEIAIDQFN